MPTNPTAKPFQSTGRRKEAVARVRLVEGKSQMMVNGKLISEVFRGPILQKKYQQPLEVTKTLGKYTATIRVVGGGTFAQVDAIALGLSRSLAKISDDYKKTLREFGLMTRDARAKERLKYGLAHAARAQKQSPKR